jgi:hypothetical protein
MEIIFDNIRRISFRMLKTRIGLTFHQRTQMHSKFGFRDFK